MLYGFPHCVLSALVCFVGTALIRSVDTVFDYKYPGNGNDGNTDSEIVPVSEYPVNDSGKQIRQLFCKTRTTVKHFLIIALGK